MKKEPYKKENAQKREEVLNDQKNIILFSCVGKTDPISKDHYDGSLLHIARKYIPGNIYLYLSSEMQENEEKDQRYSKTLKSIPKTPVYATEDIHFVYSNLDTPHVFDEFYEEFTAVIEKIREKHTLTYPYQEWDGSIVEKEISPKILLNISSGTPAMKSALEILATLGDSSLIRVQVSNPNSGNYPEPAYDVEVAIAQNKDKDLTFTKRSLEPGGTGVGERISIIATKNLLAITHGKSLKAMVQERDYSGALKFANSVKKEAGFSADLLFYLQFANFRNTLNMGKLLDLYQNNQNDCSFLPFLENFDSWEKIPPHLVDTGFYMTEYILTLDNMMKRQEYTNYIRATTPVIDKLFKRYLKSVHKVDMDIYCNGDKIWEQKFLLSDRGQGHLESIKKSLNVTNTLQNVYCTSVHMLPIILQEENGSEFGEELKKLGIAHKEVRNVAAHNLESIHEEIFLRVVGMKPTDYQETVKKLASRSNPKILEEYWDSYETMNQKIFSYLP